MTGGIAVVCPWREVGPWREVRTAEYRAEALR